MASMVTQKTHKIYGSGLHNCGDDAANVQLFIRIFQIGHSLCHLPRCFNIIATFVNEKRHSNISTDAVAVPLFFFFFFYWSYRILCTKVDGIKRLKHIQRVPRNHSFPEIFFWYVLRLAALLYTFLNFLFFNLPVKNRNQNKIKLIKIRTHQIVHK